ncbi:MAG: hypothetical protein HY901_06465 [Deltaproteobacteria bacterium]|nr:hypothetical protein [Deltaproteobacteria bacterium]
MRFSQLAPVIFAACASCAGPTRTLQLEAFLGARDDGSWASAEVHAFPGERPGGVVRIVGPDAAERESRPLDAELVAAAVVGATAQGERQTRSAEATLGAATPPLFEAGRAILLRPGEGRTRWSLGEWLAVPAELELCREEGELRLAVLLREGEEKLLAYRLPEAGATWISGVLLLPGGRRALALTGAATRSLEALHRLEGLAKVDLGSAAAALLDARAVRRIEMGELELATADLRRALEMAPEDATAHYNLACALALAGEEDQALMALGRAVDLEPERLKPLALTDPDLAALRERVEFRLMVEPRTPGAVP